MSVMQGRSGANALPPLQQVWCCCVDTQTGQKIKLGGSRACLYMLITLWYSLAVPDVSMRCSYLQACRRLLQRRSSCRSALGLGARLVPGGSGLVLRSLECLLCLCNLGHHMQNCLWWTLGVIMDPASRTPLQKPCGCRILE